MTIVHKIDQFLSKLFTSVDINNQDEIIDTLSKFYAFGPYKPKVKIEKNWAYIDIDVPTIQSEKKDYEKVVALCNNTLYEEAKPILLKLIDKNPSNSEYHRIMGQILSDEENQEEAINYLIDALRWDSKNSFALLMVGNIYAKHYNDIDTALKYYNKALEANPTDYITMVNIGVTLFQAGKLSEASKFINNALEINKDYPNAHMALTLIANSENNWQQTFENAQTTLKLCNNKDAIYQNAFKLLVSSAKKLLETTNVDHLVQQYKGKLESIGDKNILIKKDDSIPVIAKIQIAELYNRPEHHLLYKDEAPHLPHLLMHEMMHLDFILQARQANTNKKFVCYQEQRKDFLKQHKPLISKMNKMGIDPDTGNNYLLSMLDGLNSLIYNTPMDLFIEQYLHQNYIDLRPYQLLSLIEIVNFGIKAVTNKTVIDLTPLSILGPTITLNLVMAMQLKKLYGVDLLEEHNPFKNHVEEATEFFNEYLEYKDDKEPGEEYELIQHWGEDLKIDKNFTLEDEKSATASENDILDFLENIEKDPFKDDDYTPSEKREMKKFLKENSGENINPAITMFMVDALKYFDKKEKETIKTIAFDIARAGMFGIVPKKDNYKVESIPNKTFSGNHLLAYYYTSWALAIPEMLHELQMPFNKEFELAKQIVK